MARKFIYGTSWYYPKIKKYYDYGKDYNFDCYWISCHGKENEAWIEKLGWDYNKLSFGHSNRKLVEEWQHRFVNLKNRIIRTIFLVKQDEPSEKYNEFYEILSKRFRL